MSYLISRDDDLTPIKLGTILGQFQTKDLPRLRRYFNYYCGKQAIMRKQPSDVGRPCNKVVANFCHTITDSYAGYIVGKPISYEGENFDGIKDILLYNDVKTEDTELLRDALIYGKAFELCYVDEEAKQRFKVLDPRQCVPIYDDTLNQDLLYVVRFWKEDKVGNYQNEETYYVEVYGPQMVRHYRSNAGWSSFQLLEEYPHFYGQCPVSVFSLNEDEVSIFDQVMSLNDAYNELLSGSIDNWDSFADAYLILKGVSADAEDLASAKQSRCFMVDNDADINYLTKNISDTQIENMLTNIKDNIHKISNCPDLNDQQFNASTGIALRLKLTGFENVASTIEQRMRKALQRRIELLCEVASLVDNEAMWRDVRITFTRNLPLDYTDLINLVNSLRGLVSTETLLGLLPFVDNVEEEMARVAKENANSLMMYSNAYGGANDVQYQSV